ncbi:phage tail assembly chaperone G [Clostridium botulinum]|uniref:phage tail assembly chaperone G n=1 Tax=Clostridium botulinum TaxID=1491 RepID=UPI00069994E8|nr:hypothetical protein [Clostridium botulinum]KOA90874.1 hypothetical protein ADU76_12530 [Clostridium botulinum]MCD3203437.1 hypothetical protein [Clostridium botulinum C/D]MCD3222300.1 hypothetical protein [Clostridium botulinum C/D]MCD3231429.1 hypothetical protein [Clostridium botulinum C/D]MCD3273073.1 hypothetical protein [Clostridium botulinum C/D]
MKIIVKGKEYTSGKMVRSKYKIYSGAREKLIGKDTYTDEDLDLMVDVLVKLYDEQFTEDDINDDMEVNEIIFNFLSADIEIADKLNNKIEKINKVFTKGKK